eukprot:scaffold137753_cov19-Tisochrysis_lutea.AAC.3
MGTSKLGINWVTGLRGQHTMYRVFPGPSTYLDAASTSVLQIPLSSDMTHITNATVIVCVSNLHLVGLQACMQTVLEVQRIKACRIIKVLPACDKESGCGNE